MFNFKKAFFFFTILCGFAQFEQAELVIASDESDGMLIEQAPYHVPYKNYKEWTSYIRSCSQNGRCDDSFDEAAFRGKNPPELFEKIFGNNGFHFWQIKYKSDGLNIAGYIIEPPFAKGRDLPAIIYNRGGNRDFGRLKFEDLFDLARLANEGFIVVASQYRGSTGSEGKDEFGGADVHDVLNLTKLIRDRKGVDPDNLFMLGFSRGGMMTYLALKEGVKINAAAVIGGVADLTKDAKHTPDMLDVYRNLMPDFQYHAQENYDSRSVILWAEKINVPLLIMQGGADSRVDVSQSLELAQRLHTLDKPYELHVYVNDDHTLPDHRDESRSEIIKWFKKYISLGKASIR